MKFFRLAGIALAFGLAAPALAAAPAYRLIDRIKVPDGGFDYLAFDADSGHVNIARTNFTTVIDEAGLRTQECSAWSRGRPCSGHHTGRAASGRRHHPTVAEANPQPADLRSSCIWFNLL